MKIRIKSRTARLNEAAKRAPGGAKPRQCRACLAGETFSPDDTSSLAKGFCTDRAACEKRQPTLFGPEETCQR